MFLGIVWHTVSRCTVKARAGQVQRCGTVNHCNFRHKFAIKPLLDNGNWRIFTFAYFSDSPIYQRILLYGFFIFAPLPKLPDPHEPVDTGSGHWTAVADRLRVQRFPAA